MVWIKNSLKIVVGLNIEWKVSFNLSFPLSDRRRPGLGARVFGLAEGRDGEREDPADERGQGSGETPPGHGRQQAQGRHLQRCGTVFIGFF